MELSAREIRIANERENKLPTRRKTAMHANSSDEELLKLIGLGDENAFIALYRRRQGAIYRFALRMSGSESVAEDVTQEVFLHLMRGEGNFDPDRGSFQSYLFGIARNQTLRRLERDRPYLLIVNDEDEDESPAIDGLVCLNDPLGDLTRRETIESVRQAVLALPTHHREVVVLCDLHEMSYQQAAEILGCAIGTVRSRLHRARAVLVNKLQAMNAETSAEKRSAETTECFV